MLRYDKHMLTLTSRQAIPRNLTPSSPASMGLETVQPVPTNDQYGRPRSNGAEGREPYPLTLVARVSVADLMVWVIDIVGGVAPFTLDFGDGTAPVEGAPRRSSHTYAAVGDYTVEVADSDGTVDTATITVDQVTPPLALVWPLDGSTMPRIFDFFGRGADPSTEVELWSSSRDPEVDDPNAVVVADAAGHFGFTGSHEANVGTETWHVENGTDVSPSITVTVEDT